jgi:N-hydroxyarylamine O-acetyltransferase
MVARHLPDRHVVVTHDAVTIRRPGEPTEHHELEDGELDEWLATLEVSLTSEEERRLRGRVDELRTAGSALR